MFVHTHLVLLFLPLLSLEASSKYILDKVVSSLSGANTHFVFSRANMCIHARVLQLVTYPIVVHLVISL